MNTRTPPTVEEILAGATVSTMDDSEIDDLLNQGKTEQQLNESQNQKAKDAVDALIAAIHAVANTLDYVSTDPRQDLLNALKSMAIKLELTTDDIERVKTALQDGGWSDVESAVFLDYCELVPPLPRFQPRTMRHLLTMPPKQWIIDQVLGAGDIGMVYGAPGCGKTFVVIDMIFSACLGQQFASRFEVARPLNVAYAAGEGISGLPSRFAAAAEHFGTDDIANFTFFETTPQFYHDKECLSDDISCFVNEWKQRQAEGEAQPLDLLIIDTLHSATAGADENSAQHMGIVLRTAKNAAQELGCAVLLVHHTNKNGTAERGSSALRGAMDCMIEIRRISETGTKAVMSCAKLKDGEGWKDQTFDLVSIGESGESVRVWWDEPSTSSEGDRRKSETAKEILGILAEKVDRSLPSKKIADVIGQSPQAVNRVLARIVKDGFVKRDEDKRGTAIFCITEKGVEMLDQHKPV